MKAKRSFSTIRNIVTRVLTVKIRMALPLVIALVSALAGRSSAEDKLYPNQLLFEGQSIVSQNCRFRLKLINGFLML